MANQFVLIEAAGPAYTPLQYGLLSVADPVTSSERWRQGIMRREPVCDPAGSALAVPCVTGGPQWTPTVTGAPFVASDPFTVVAWAPCSPVGWGPDLAELRDRTVAALTNGEARAVEHVVWTGAPTIAGGVVYPHLAADTEVFADAQGAVTVRRQSAAEVLGAGLVDVVEAFGLLEGELAACYGAQGVLHVPRAALPHLDHANLVRREGQQLRTLSGNTVAAYAAGDRHGPAGSEPAAGQTWMYATGAVQVYASPIIEHTPQPGEFIGRTDNTTVFVVQRAYLVTWDCCHLAAQVSLGGMVAGAAGGAT